MNFGLDMCILHMPQIGFAVMRVLHTCTSHWSQCILVESEALLQCMGSHVFVEYITTSEIEESTVVLVMRYKPVMMMMMMMIWCLTSLSTLFKSYQDNGRMLMKGYLYLCCFFFLQ